MRHRLESLGRPAGQWTEVPMVPRVDSLGMRRQPRQRLCSLQQPSTRGPERRSVVSAALVAGRLPSFFRLLLTGVFRILASQR
jgi:hypothetical protein